MRNPLVITLALGASLLGPAASAGVWTVAGSGPADFTQIADAVAAAQDGDLILVGVPAGGGYAGFTIDGKGLVVSTMNPGAGMSTGAITIKNLAAGQTVVLRGLVATAPASPPASGLRVLDCAGTVRTEECYFTGSSPTALGAVGRSGISCTNAASLVLFYTSVDGGRGASSDTNDWNAMDGGPGLFLEDSTAWVHWGQVRGGNGGSHFDPDILPTENFQCGDGAPGAFLYENATLTCAGTTFSGGNGGSQIIGADKSYGGPGVTLWDGLLRQRDNHYVPGTGTQKHAISPDIATVQPEAVETSTTLARRLITDSPRHEFETLHLKVQGQGGDQALLVLGFGPHAQWFSGLQGGLLVNPLGAALLPLGTVPLAGEKTFNFTVPSLPAGLEHVELYLQLAIAIQGHTTLENTSTVVLLDATL